MVSIWFPRRPTAENKSQTAKHKGVATLSTLYGEIQLLPEFGITGGMFPAECKMIKKQIKMKVIGKTWKQRNYPRKRALLRAIHMGRP